MKQSISRDTSRNCHRVIVSLEDQSICKATISHYGKNRQQLEKLAKTSYADELYNKLPPEVFCAFRTTADLSTGITISSILAVNNEDILGLIKAKDRQRLIDVTRSLCSHLSTKGISNLTTSDCLDAIGSYIRQSNAQTAEEKKYLHTTCCDVLKLVFGYCVTTGVIASNPMKLLKKSASAEQIMKDHMRVKSLTASQEKDIFSYLCEDGYQDPRKFGMVLRLLTGLTSQEVCGLQFSDLHPMNQLAARMPDGGFTIPHNGGDYVLVISRVHSKLSDKFRISELVSSQSVFRVIPLSDICLQQIIARIKYLQNAYGLKDELQKMPMVCEYGDGEEHLYKFGRPDNLGKYINKSLADHGVHQENLYVPSQVIGDNYGSSTIPLPVNARLLRNHFEYKAKYVCGLTEGEVDYLLGRKPHDVDSRHYREFRELYNQLSMKAKLDRWQINEIFAENSSGSPTPYSGPVRISQETAWPITLLPGSNKELAASCLSIKSEKSGEAIMIDVSCLKGFHGSLIIKIA